MDLRTFIARYGKYGNYGGPGHSGERRNADGSIYIDPGTKKPVQFYLTPIDRLDYAFKLHDLAYDAAKQNGNQPQDIMLADIQLLINMWILPSDPENPDLPYPDNRGLQYCEAATSLFVGKLIADGLKYDANLLNQLMAQVTAAGIMNLVSGLDFLVNINGQETSFEQVRDPFLIPKFNQSPIVLDLDGDGVETTGVKDGAYFDHDGNGFAEQSGWASSDDGLLVMDRNADGRIDTGQELFGNETLLLNSQKAANGFAALAELDTNTDGKIDVNDAAYSQLKVWQDINGDGSSSADELKTLSELNIASINTGYADSTLVDANGNEHRQVGTFTRTDNSTGAAVDVWFKADKMYTIADEWVEVPETIAALPDLQGYGNVYDLQQAAIH